MVLPPSDPYPKVILDMLDNPQCLAKVRKDNASFSFVSFNANQDNNLMKNNVYTLRIHGQIHHRIGPLIPTEDSKHCCAHIYFKGEDEVKLRQEYSSGLNPLVLIQLQSMFH